MARALKGYFGAISEYQTGPVYQEGSMQFAGEFIMTFSCVIDVYHSDVLRNDTATPTWLRTVGYQNNSLNVGYTSRSAGYQQVGSRSLVVVTVSVAGVAIFLVISYLIVVFIGTYNLNLGRIEPPIPTPASCR